MGIFLIILLILISIIFTLCFLAIFLITKTEIEKEKIRRTASDNRITNQVMDNLKK